MFDFSTVQSENSYITKEFILSKLSSKDIIEHYLNVKLSYSNLISSPFRQDKNPSFGIREIEPNIFIAKDFSTSESYDCFSIVQKLYNCNFSEALRIIANDFRLSKISTTATKTLYNNTDNIRITSNKKKAIITIEKQDYTEVDKQYWGNYGITTDTLSKFQVHSCKYVWLNGNLFKTYSNNNPTYAYEFNKAYKIYSPLTNNKKAKWLFSGIKNDIEGYNFLITKCFQQNNDIQEQSWNSQLLIITKSLKDVMCLYHLGYHAISLQGESNTLDFETYNKLFNLGFRDFCIFYDNDEPGINGANSILKDYPSFSSIMIPEEYNCKDISDFIYNYGLADAQELLDSLL